jgi:hypothetical protein
MFYNSPKDPSTMAKEISNFDSSIRIEVDPEDNLDNFEEMLKDMSPKERRWAMRYFDVSMQFSMHTLGESLEKLKDALWDASTRIPPATRERSEKLRELVLKGWSNRKIADFMDLSVRQVIRDKENLGLVRLFRTRPDE